MIDPATLQALGTATRGGLTGAAELLVEPSREIAYALAYAQAANNNLLFALEQDAGVPNGFFGSQGFQVLFQPPGP
jgi:hypothetical protein